MAKKMNKSTKKGLQFGIGLGYLAMETLERELKKLEKKGKISRKESEKLVLDTIRDYQAQGEKYAKQVQDEIDKFAKSNPVATKKDLAALNARIQKLTKPAKKRKR